MEVSLEEAIKEFKLSKEEHDRISQVIINVYTNDKYQVDSPRAIINIAPPASGKTSLNVLSKTKFNDENVIIINSDELKLYHPKIEEIAKKYPQYYTKITDEESNLWTSTLFDRVLKDKYNVIFEGTGKNTRILDTVAEKMQEHHVTVRGLAVNELNCLLSILERFEYQVKMKGWGRLVVLDHFYQTYEAMPNVIDTIEKSGKVDIVEVFKRSELAENIGKEEIAPISIYKSTDKGLGRFGTSKNAVLAGREEDKNIAVKNTQSQIGKIEELLNKEDVTEAENKILNKIKELYQSSCDKEFER